VGLIFTIVITPVRVPESRANLGEAHFLEARREKKESNGAINLCLEESIPLDKSC
jgi:hypothetical protein